MAERADAVVVGGGIMGASAAAHRLAAGKLVVSSPNRRVASASRPV